MVTSSAAREQAASARRLEVDLAIDVGTEFVIVMSP